MDSGGSADSVRGLNLNAEEFVPGRASTVSSEAPASVAEAGDGEDPEELEEEEEEEDGVLDQRLVANLQLCPLDIRFSQFRARSRFRDGKLLADSEAMIRAVPITPGAASSSATGSSSGTQGDKEAVDRDSSADFLLETPFPPIQVLQWRCKLRDGQGRPRTDPKTGGELYDNEDRWFSLDNRRLYCLQKAAIRVWPQRVVANVVELPPGPLTRTRTRQLKKFRTFDRGKTILIGGRNEVTQMINDAGKQEQANIAVKWSWREKVGQEADADSEPDIHNAHIQMRRRRRENERGRGGRDSDAHRRRLGGVKDQPESGFLPAWTTSWGGIFLFCFIYLCLRIVAKVIHGIYLKMQDNPET